MLGRHQSKTLLHGNEAIKISNGSFAWSSAESLTLQNISLTVEKVCFQCLLFPDTEVETGGNNWYCRLCWPWKIVSPLRPSEPA